MLTTDDGHILRVWTGITGLTKATPQNMLIPRIVWTVDITEENDTRSMLDSVVHHIHTTQELSQTSTSMYQLTNLPHVCNCIYFYIVRVSKLSASSLGCTRTDLVVAHSAPFSIASIAYVDLQSPRMMVNSIIKQPYIAIILRSYVYSEQTYIIKIYRVTVASRLPLCETN